MRSKVAPTCSPVPSHTPPSAHGNMSGQAADSSVLVDAIFIDRHKTFACCGTSFAVLPYYAAQAATVEDNATNSLHAWRTQDQFVTKCGYM